MSGIAGILSFGGGPADPMALRQMTDAMAHRGPDGITHWDSPNVVLGQCQLATTIQSTKETQPLLSPDGRRVLVMDGRIDNRDDLRDKLENHTARLRDDTDAELVLHACDHWGADAPRHIEGDFAFALWNTETRILLAARDHAGHRPFFYHWNTKHFSFASELKALLLLPWVPETLYDPVVAEFIASEWHEPIKTYWTDICRLQQAHVMTVDGTQPRQHEYWRPDTKTPIIYSRDSEYVDHYLHLLDTVLCQHSRSHKPLAIEVSGGLDSSALFCMADRMQRDARLPAPGFEGFSLNFNDGTIADEQRYVDALESFLGRPVHRIDPTIPKLSTLDAFGRREKVFTPYPTATMHDGIHTAAHKGGHVVKISGVGGDDWLGGSRITYADALYNLRLRDMRDLLCADLADLGLYETLVQLRRHGLEPLAPTLLIASLRKAYQKATGILDKPDLFPEPLARYIRNARLTPRLRHIDRLSYAHKMLMKQLFDPCMINIFESVEHRIAHAGLEHRAPLYSRPMIEFSFAVGERRKRHGDTNRVLHVKAMRGILPPAIRSRTDKAFFGDLILPYLPEFQTRWASVCFEQSHPWLKDSETAQNLLKQVRSRNHGTSRDWAVWSVNAFGVFVETQMKNDK